MKRGVRGEGGKKKRDEQYAGIELAHGSKEERRTSNRGIEKGVIGMRGCGFMGVEECGGGGGTMGVLEVVCGICGICGVEA